MINMLAQNGLPSTNTEKLEDENRLQLTKWNETPPKALDRCVHELICSRCLAQPTAPAVSAWDGDFTYAELDRASSRLAFVLKGIGVTESGSFVAICMERSRWTAVAMLAIMKAGAAFVLLDPSHPADRIRQIYDLVAAQLVLTTTQLVNLLSSIGLKAIAVDAGEGDGANSLSTYQTSVNPSSMLYVVFTSGSTGEPKGAMISHAAYASSAAAYQEPFHLNTRSRVFQYASFAFDASVYDHLSTLLAGGCICIPSEFDRQSDLPGAISRLNANWMFLTPSVASSLNPQKVPSLKHLVLGGEALTRSIIDQWLPYVNLIGLYGPAEYAVAVTVHPNLAHAASPTDIGYPFGASCWIVDPSDPDKLVPMGDEGELLLEGPGLSRGYINQPGLTTAAFLSPPAWLAPARNSEFEWLYRTGDIVRYNMDGSLQFVGRKDTQVKLRGQRVELGEIEYHVMQCLLNMHDTVAEVISTNTGSAQLVVFLYDPDSSHTAKAGEKARLISPNKPIQQQIQTLKELLQQRLPSSMNPDIFLVVSHIPLTITGKKDRRQLRNLVAQLSPLQLHKYCGFEQADTSAELYCEKRTRLRAVWADILGLNPSDIPLTADWFHLGGDSLLTIKMVARAHDVGLHLTSLDVLKHRTFDRMAHMVKEVHISAGVVEPFSLAGMLSSKGRIQSTKEVEDQYRLLPYTIEDLYPCNPMQLSLISQSATGRCNYTLWADAQLAEHVSDESFQQAWHSLAQANPMLRTQIAQLKSGKYAQVVVKEVIEVETSTSALLSVPRRPELDLWGLKRPLLRIQKLGNRMRLYMHHVLYDGYTLCLIFQQLARCLKGEQLPALSFTPFLQWTSTRVAAADAFWSAAFSGVQFTPFPPSPHSNHIPEATCVLDTVAVPLKSQHVSFSPDSAARLALAVTLSKILNAPDVLFLGEVARRDAPVPGIGEVIGPAACSFPCLVHIEPNETVVQSLERLQLQLVRARQFQCVEVNRIATLAPETAAACQSQTLLVVQPDAGQHIPEIFSSWEYQYPTDRRAFAPHGLCVLCYLSGGHMNVYLSYDAQMLGEGQAQRILTSFTQAFQFIDNHPGRPINELLGTVTTPEHLN